MTIDINLNWLSFNVNMALVHAWLLANAGPHYCGASANSMVQAHFTDEPGDSVRSAIAAYWSGLNESSDEATSYKTKEELDSEAAAAKAAALATARTKLEALGLSADEIAALRG